MQQIKLEMAAGKQNTLLYKPRVTNFSKKFTFSSFQSLSPIVKKENKEKQCKLLDKTQNPGFSSVALDKKIIHVKPCVSLHKFCVHLSYSGDFPQACKGATDFSL